MSASLEVAAKFLGEAQRWGDTIIAELQTEDGFFKAKGPAEVDELEPQLWYRFWGRWENHYRYGRQFVFDTVVPSRALDQEGMVRYLCRAPHVGKTTAKKLVAAYQSDAVKRLREEPITCVEAVKVRGFTEERAREAAAFLADLSGTESATIELVGLFAGKAFPRRLHRKCLKAWGNKAPDVVKANPYVLLQFSGVGFARADELYLSLGHDPKALERQARCAWYRCAGETDGHTWLPSSDLHSELLTKIGGAEVNLRGAIEWALANDLLEHRVVDGAHFFAAKNRADDEGRVAQRAAEMRFYTPPSWPNLEGLEVSQHQRGELSKALAGGRLGLFTGSPGTGKTYSAARLIAAIRVQHGGDSVAVVAPTGKAAVRVTEALREHGVDIRARTVHSYLGVRGGGEDSEFAFDHGADNPVEELFVICDEASMLDSRILGLLLEAMRMDGHLLLVGDVNQLPPVGHGAPLRDLIDSGLAARGELTEIRRNSGAIVKTCAAIRDGADWHIPSKLDPQNGGNLAIIQRDANEDDEILNLVERIRQTGRHDPVWDVQILCAVNERGALSRVELNRRLQRALNGANSSKSAFWNADKVVCLKNSFFPLVEDLMEGVGGEVTIDVDQDGRARAYVANGELGQVRVDDPKKTVVEFSSPKRVVIVPKGKKGSGIDLGYALSCHKAQGSEWPVVLVALDASAGARMVCDRSWIYTAISRAKKACLLVGLMSTAQTFARSQKIKSRRTFLGARIRETLEALEQAEKEVVEDARDDDVPVEVAAVSEDVR